MLSSNDFSSLSVLVNNPPAEFINDFVSIIVFLLSYLDLSIDTSLLSLSIERFHLFFDVSSKSVRDRKVLFRDHIGN